MDEKTDPVGHTDPVEHKAHNMNIPSEAESSSSKGLLETAGDGATVINSISIEFEKLLKPDAAVESIKSVISKLMDELEELQSEIAEFADEAYMKVGKTEWKKRSQKIRKLVNEFKQCSEKMSDDGGKLYSAVGTIMERVRFWSPTTAAAQLPLLDYRWSKHDGGDVFLSHSGKQKNFVRQLYLDLSRKHVSCFFDENQYSLPPCQNIVSLIFKAARTCKIAVVVLSKDFIISRWPMMELVAFRESANVKLLPIFFMISPNEVSKDTPEWKTLSNETRDQWHDALEHVRRIKGFHFREGDNEVALRDEVVKAICSCRRIFPPKLLELKPVGIEEQVREVKNLLDIEGAQEALAVIVYGVRGMGTSTLAASVVESLDWSLLPARDIWFCRVEIDEKTPDKISHIMKLQYNILLDLGEELQGGVYDLRDQYDGLFRIEAALSNKYVLLFINNVFDKEYLNHLFPKRLPSGEHTKLRVIITSSDTNLIVELGNGIECQEYEMKGLSATHSESLLLETIQRGRNAEVGLDDKNMIKIVAPAFGGLPLLLYTFGKQLKMGSSKGTYDRILEDLAEGNLNSFTDEDLRGKLMFQYDKIKDVEVKEAFLDICAYFDGWQWDAVDKIVKKYALPELQRRLLVSKSSSDKVIVHKILLGIGRKEGRCTRFSNYNELSNALEDNLDVLKKVTGISLVDNNITIESTQLEAMPQLKFLILGDCVTLKVSPCNRAFKKMKHVRVGDTEIPFKVPFKLDKLKDLLPQQSQFRIC